jgi:hypothetical protein
MRRSSLAMTKHEQLIRLKDEYRAAHDNAPASPRDIADWAVKEGMYDLAPHAAERRCAQELADAMRTEFMTVDGGRRVRVMHAWASPQGNLWDDIRTISRENLEISLAQKRNGIVGEVKQIKQDMDYFDSLHPDDPRLQMSFDFTNDLADAGLLEVLASGPKLHVERGEGSTSQKARKRLPYVGQPLRSVSELPPPESGSTP